MRIDPVVVRWLGELFGKHYTEGYVYENTEEAKRNYRSGDEIIFLHGFGLLLR